jgi:hypothetical protein
MMSCGMPGAQQRDSKPLQRNDIKQKTNRVYPPRSREAVIPVFLVLTVGNARHAVPPRDALTQ